MKRILVIVSILSCFSVMLLSCASIITHKDTNTNMTSPLYTTPQMTTTVNEITTPSWVTQTGNNVTNSHSGYVMTNIHEKTLTALNGAPIISAKILSPEIVLYDNEGLQLTVNTNLLTVFNVIEEKVNAVCNRYSNCDPSSFISLPNVLVDYRLEYFTKEAMCIKFQITETDENANVYKSFLCYHSDRPPNI